MKVLDFDLNNSTPNTKTEILLSYAKNTNILIEQIMTKPQETLEYGRNTQEKTSSCDTQVLYTTMKINNSKIYKEKSR